MQYQLLSDFYQDEATRETVKSFLLASLDKLALKKVYKKEDTSGVADAKVAIEEAFEDLEDLIQTSTKKKINKSPR